jgi:peptidoglycan glycosyltransferase
MASLDPSRQRPDPLITPHKPGRVFRFEPDSAQPSSEKSSRDHKKNGNRTTYGREAEPKNKGGFGGGRRPRGRGRSRLRLRLKGIFGWRFRLAGLVILAVIALLAARNMDSGTDVALPSLRKGAPADLPPPQLFPAQDTVRTREGRWVTHYAADEVLQARTERYVNQYRPEGAVVVVCDLRTGQIRALVERDSNITSSRPRLALGTTFPAASLAKIVTAAAVLERGIYRPHDDLPLVGGAHTLYRAQLRLPTHGRYNTVTLREAFARSINPTFGMLGLRVGPQSLRDMAQRMGFSSAPRTGFTAASGTSSAAADNTDAEDGPYGASDSQARFTPPDTGDFALAEVASGYTTATTISPLHALRIARAVGQDGRLLPVSFTRELRSLDNGRMVTLPRIDSEPFASASTLQSLRTLMEATVTSGTARRGFRRNMTASDFERLEMGGKTGSLNGHNPPGRYEWFIGYARHKEHPDQGIAVAVMLINRTYLAVHATELAGLVIRDWSRYSAPYPDEDGRYLAGR